MATDFGQLLNNSLGGFFGLPQMASIESVILHIQSRLPQFARENRGETATNENGLTQRLVHVLSLNHKLPYFFDKEYLEEDAKGNSARSDFTVMTNQPVKMNAILYPDRSRILAFEAKRLASLNTGREREYLEGRYDPAGKFINSGGVERFKNGTHGRGLDQAGIIAYAQEEDFAHWEKQITAWTQDLISRSPVRDENWTADDLLMVKTQDLPDWKYFTSTCARNQGPETIILHHVWISLI